MSSLAAAQPDCQPQHYTLTARMAQHGYTAGEIAYAVEKPRKHTDLITRAQLGAQPPED